MITLFFVAWTLLDPSPSPLPQVVCWDAKVLKKAPTQILLANENGASAVIDGNGEITLRSGMTLNELSRAFWEHIDRYNPLRAEVERLRMENAKLRAASGAK